MVCCGDYAPVCPRRYFSMRFLKLPGNKRFFTFPYVSVVSRTHFVLKQKILLPIPVYQITAPGVLILLGSNTKYSATQIIAVLFTFPSVAFLLSFQSDIPSRFPLRVLCFLTTHDSNEKPNNLFQYIISSSSINNILSITKENIHPTEVL